MVGVRLLKGLCTAVGLLSGLPALADVIYQAHNMKFADVEHMLPDLVNRGITHIQISPPQKSNPAPDWWARYQPFDFRTIESPLGNENDLRSLTSAAHRVGRQVIVDVVFNHMGNFDGLPCSLAYPWFSRQDFHGDCRSHQRDSENHLEGWLGGDLPDLRTESPYVREQAKQYLTMLMDMGVDGFRFDAAGHIEPGFFEELNGITKPRGRFSYGEVLVHYNRIALAWQYTKHMSVTDYPLMGRMVDAFAFGGDLRVLKWPAFENRALPGLSAVTFVNNHDLHEHPWDFGGLLLDGTERNGQPSDRTLAHAYILGRQEGFPMVFRNDLYHPLVAAGIHFHESAMGKPEYFRDANEYHPAANSPSLLFIERGAWGLVVINKGGDWLDVPWARMPGLEPGCFKDLHHGFFMEVGENPSGRWVTKWGSSTRGGMKVGPRDALFFVRAYPSDCAQI